MWQTLQQESFWVGATLIVIYQAAKFTELNLSDPLTSRYVTLLPDAKARDFAGSFAYHCGLAAFLAVSLIVYFLLCSISPGVLKGAVTILTGTAPQVSIESVSYPLYIAALFIGLTQPIIPILSQFGIAQRDFFHDRIEVPGRIIEVAGKLVGAIELRAGADKRRLADEVRYLANGDFLAALQGYGDRSFYQLQIEKLKLDGRDVLEQSIKESSARELRGLVERLVLCALVATMRRSGPYALIKVGESLGVPIATGKAGSPWHFLASFISSAVLFTLALLILAEIFWLLVSPVAQLFPEQQVRLWPEDFTNAVVELWYIVPPIFISLLVAVFFLVPHDRSQIQDFESKPDSSLGSEFVDFFRSSAVILGMCIGITVMIQIGQLFYQYGIYVPPEERGALKVILTVIQAFIPVAVCLFTTWFLVSSNAQSRRGLSFTATLMAIAGATALVGFIYEQAFVQDYLRDHPQAAPGWDHVLFGVIANVLVSICAFASTALFFTARDKRPAHHGQTAAERAGDQDPGRAWRTPVIDAVATTRQIDNLRTEKIVSPGYTSVRNH